ncbi:caveolae-associated protein 2b [Genypterus blacodes]|uniref:caveolae-associated protein 2b n=1 Tax=Genypterus blacodes TaxID=154954 RepID=UPI003F7753D7
MCENAVHLDRIMVSSETHQTQELLVPPQPDQDQDQDQDQDKEQPVSLSSPSGAPLMGLDPEQMNQGPVNAITVLTLLDKLVNMLDAVQENQHKMEVHQVEMEGVVRGIQADMTKLSKSHSHTSNTVSKLLDKSRKLSVTMKEVKERMERQGLQVKRLEMNHAHLINRNNFKVLIFQEENEIPSSVFVKDPPPFPREEVLEEGELAVDDKLQEEVLQTIDLSSDEDVGLEAELEEETGLHDLENMEKSRAEKLKHSSLKKVDSFKKAFSVSRHNIEKKMTKIGTKIVSVEQREKIKQKTSSLKVSPLSFSIRKPRSSSDSHPVDVQEGLFTEDQAQQTPQEEEDWKREENEKEQKGVEKEEEEKEVEEEEEEKGVEEEKKKEEQKGVKEEEEEEEQEASEVDQSLVSEGVSEEFALSSTLPQEEKEKEEEERLFS